MKRVELLQSKVLSGIDLERWLTIARFKRQKIVFTSGSFDLLHQGHIRFLSEARDRGDHLVVALHTDEELKKRKGEHRPLLDQDTRALVLAALHFISAVVLTDDEGLPDLIRLIRPDILALTADNEDLSRFEPVKDLVGEVVRLEGEEGFSTAGIGDSITTG